MHTSTQRSHSIHSYDEWSSGFPVNLTERSFSLDSEGKTIKRGEITDTGRNRADSTQKGREAGRLWEAYAVSLRQRVNNRKLGIG